MSTIPAELKYSKEHEWIQPQADGTVRIGITEHAQGLLGDMVFVELPESGRQLATGEECAVVESVKAASDVYAPIAGEVVESNDAVVDAPELLNSDPFGDGWLFVMRPDDPSELDGLLDADGYAALVAEES